MNSDNIILIPRRVRKTLCGKRTLASALCTRTSDALNRNQNYVKCATSNHRWTWLTQAENIPVTQRITNIFAENVICPQTVVCTTSNSSRAKTLLTFIRLLPDLAPSHNALPSKTKSRCNGRSGGNRTHTTQYHFVLSNSPE